MVKETTYPELRKLRREPRYPLSTEEAFGLLRAGFRVYDRRKDGTGVHALPS